MENLPHKSNNFPREFHLPNQSPDFLWEIMVSVLNRTGKGSLFKKHVVSFLNLIIVTRVGVFP